MNARQRKTCANLLDEAGEYIYGHLDCTSAEFGALVALLMAVEILQDRVETLERELEADVF